VDVQVAGGLLSEKSESADESKWVAYGQGNESLTFSWRRKTEDHHTTQPLRMRGSLIELVSLGEDSASVYAEVNLDVSQGAAAEVRIQLPENVTVNQVLGATVADWEMKSGELAVKFLEPVEQNSRFVINGETRLARDGKIDIPLLRLLNTEKDTGGVAAEVLGAGEIKDFKTQGMEEADASDLGETVASRQSPSLEAFRFRSGEAAATRSLTVNVARYTQQAVLMANIEEARYQVLMSKEGKSLIQARYTVRNNQRNFVKITLPAGAAVWSATLACKPIRPGQSPDGSLLVPLEKARGGGRPAPICCRGSLSRSRSKVGRQRQSTTRLAGARSADFAHRAAALLPASVPDLGRARHLPNRELCESDVGSVQPAATRPSSSNRDRPAKGGRPQATQRQ